MRGSRGATLALVATAGCFGPPSQIDASSSVRLSGVVQTQAGDAPPATTVELIRHPDPLQLVGEVIGAVGTVGLACLGGRLDICSPLQQSVTAGDGSYQFSLLGSDTQGATGEALTFTVFSSCATRPAAAVADCAVAAEFLVQTQHLTIPSLRQWTALGSEDDATGDPHFSWPQLQSAVGGAAADDYSISIHDGSGQLVWLQDALAQTNLIVDRHATQDFAGSWAVAARRKQAEDEGDFAISWYSPAQAYASRNLNPLSRTSDCYVQAAAGPARITRPCPLTDGNLATRFTPVPAPACPTGTTCSNPPQNNWIAIDIGFQHPMALLVLYDVAISGATQKLAIEKPNDLMIWTPLATVPATPYQVVPLSVVSEFLRLRVVDPDGAFTGGGNSELAIYAPGV